MSADKKKYTVEAVGERYNGSNNNYSYGMRLTEFPGKIVNIWNQQPKVGDILEGTITEKTKDGGKTFYTFKKPSSGGSWGRGGGQTNAQTALMAAATMCPHLDGFLLSDEAKQVQTIHHWFMKFKGLLDKS